MKVSIVLLVALGVSLCVAVSPPAGVMNKMRFSERRRASLSGGTKVSCADLQPTAKWQAAMNTMFGSSSDEKKMDFISGSGNGKWEYNAIAYNNVHGNAWPEHTEVTYTDFDLCKLFPQTVCNHAKTSAWPGKNFCSLSDKHKAMCCPLAQPDGTARTAFEGKVANADPKVLTTGCPSSSKVAGVARSFMPQVDSVEDFVAWYKFITKKDVGPEEKEVPMDLVSPTQDEMFLFKSVKKICVLKDKNVAGVYEPVGTAMAGPKLSRLSVCEQGADAPGSNLYFILDGHHRYSQKALCGAITDCKVHSADPVKLNKIAVNVFKDSCVNMIGATHSLLDYVEGKKHVDPFDHAETPSAKLETRGKQTGMTEIFKYDNDKKSTGIHFTAQAFVEIDSLFGRAAHQSRAEAARAYVTQTRARLAAAGLSLKGGDEALLQWFNVRHAPRLWQ